MRLPWLSVSREMVSSTTVSTRTTERTRRPETNIIKQHQQDVRRSSRRPYWLDRRETRRRVLSVVGNQTLIPLMRNRQHLTPIALSSHGSASRVDESSKSRRSHPRPYRSTDAPVSRPFTVLITAGSSLCRLDEFRFATTPRPHDSEKRRETLSDNTKQKTQQGKGLRRIRPIL